MNSVTRRKLEMGEKALNFSLAHPDPSPGYAAALAALEQRLLRAQELTQAQQQGIELRKAANARKNELRRRMRRAQLRHIARVAKVAVRERPDLDGKFVLRSEPRNYRSFRALAGTLLAEAQTEGELLVKHGLAATVLESLVQSLAEFDRAVNESTDALRIHVNARVVLDRLGDEVVDYVQVMDGLNRDRFATDPGVLAEWEVVSNVLAPARSDDPKPPAPGAERQAA